ncbi:hypothetical protein GURASL_13320 [Geotalea uraniireducens]|uniref:XRE family transcriptional regulator n=1 Tax=Geotalea uraniireducens TaxID=351604 RepID=A0ABM8EIY7_9BACT|nr:hypothetical protein [Geotalea uraniireducens]BDV42409.1 hypothetical protein GURASL_13320 [Geotalea uraniireducens]
MSRDNLFSFFITLLKTEPAAQIAAATGYSQGTVSQVKNGKYQGDDTIFLQAVFAVYGKWQCPNLGTDVDLQQCRAEMAKPYSAGRVRQWAVCQQCERRS